MNVDLNIISWSFRYITKNYLNCSLDRKLTFEQSYQITEDSCSALYKYSDAAQTNTLTHRSTRIPALIALATLRNFGLSLTRRLTALWFDLVKVIASQSRTSFGTASVSTRSFRSSSSSLSSSTSLLTTTEKDILLYCIWALHAVTR